MRTLSEDAASRCVECGECLFRCRYMSLSRREAQREIRKINEGKDSKVFSSCVSCYACDAFCPRDAKPYERILAFWNRRYEERGLPERIRFFLPHLRPNFRQDLPYTPEEASIRESWRTPEPPAERVLYPGCNLLAFPLLWTGTLARLLPAWGDWDACCGEMYFRMGLFSPVRAVAEKLTRRYAGSGVKEMVFVCPACWNMFQNALPQNFGARFDFKRTFFTDWFFESLQRGDLSIKNPLDLDVVVHDSCHGRVLGPDFMNGQRKLLKTLGLTLYETGKNQAQGLCCGMAAGARRYGARDVLWAGMRAFRALLESPAGRAAIYCTGCLLTLSLMQTFYPSKMELNHFLSLIQRALGEERPQNPGERAGAVLRGTLSHALPGYLSKKRFFLELE